MNNLKIDNGIFPDIMRELNGITNSGKLVKKVFKFIQENINILESEEYFIEERDLKKEALIEEIMTKSQEPVFFNSLILNNNYHINLKKSTFIIIAFLLDSTFSKGITSLALNMAGFSTKSIQKINAEEKCLLLDVLKKANDFNYHDQYCYQKDINCPFQTDYKCHRSSNKIKTLLSSLQEKGVLTNKNGKYAITF